MVSVVIYLDVEDPQYLELARFEGEFGDYSDTQTGLSSVITALKNFGWETTGTRDYKPKGEDEYLLTICSKGNTSQIIVSIQGM